MKKIASIIIVLISAVSHASCWDVCDDEVSRQVLIKSMEEIANKWDYRSNVCGEPTFHQIADSYREISVAHERVSLVCATAPDYLADALKDLKLAKKKLDEIELLEDEEFQNDNCPHFDFFLTSMDAAEDH